MSLVKVNGKDVISDIKGEEIVQTFYKKELQKSKLKRGYSWKSN